jgi:dipeptidyl-peptidase-4
MRILFFLILALPVLGTAQQNSAKKKITLEDIFKKGTFLPDEVSMGGSVEEEKLFESKEILDESGKAIDTRNYQVSGNKKNILFFTDREPIYRRSSRANVYLYDVASKKTVLLNKGKVMHPTFSPDGTRLAYVYDNNLYVRDLGQGTTTAVTKDGKWNYIINGNADWVYEEEFSFSRAFDWSPNGTYIAYYRFDESNVKEYNMTIYDDRHNKDYRYKYPKPGDENSKVEIHIYNVTTGQDVKAQYEQGDIYIPRIKWTQADNKLVVYWMNRLQNNLKLLMTDAATGAATKLYEETNKYYVDINDDWWFLKDGKHFLFGSEMNGWYRIYLYSIDGKKKTELTKGKYDIADINGVDEANKLVYYTAAYPTPMDRNLFVTDFEGRNTYQLTSGPGWHRADINSDFTRFTDFYSDINTPQTVTTYTIKKEKRTITAVKDKVINESRKLKSIMSGYALGQAEFLRVPNTKGDTLNAWMLKPADFDPAKKYALLFCNYGGPGSQQVANRFGAVSFWHQMLAQNGIIVVSVDNTGTGFRGEEFKKKTYLRLGQLEIEDQIDAAKHFGKLPYIDDNRIGHWGHSFGGFMSSLAITKGADVFKAAVAGAPVTSWRYYDNIYTERFMRTPQENAKGYDETAPINFTDRIKGHYLIIHGTADDNVHFQNSVQMISALVKSNIDFESAYYPNKNHGISGSTDNTTYHRWSKVTRWLFQNLRDDPSPVGGKAKPAENKTF